MQRVTALVLGRPGLVALVVGALLLLPALATPLFLDDHLHGAMIEGRFPAPRAAYDLYDFLRPDERPTFAARGLVPWWSDPGLQIRFFRPLASLLRAAEGVLFGRAAGPLHVHSLLWWGAAVLAARRLFQAVTADRRVVALATFAFATAPAHVIPVAWIANREALLAATFGLLATERALAFTRRGDRSAAAVGALSFVGALGAGEYALAFLALLAVPLVEATPRRRRLALAIAAATLTAGYLGLRHLAHAGAHGSGFYADPFDAPGRFASLAPRRVATLLVEGWLGLDGETLPFAGFSAILVAAAMATIGLFAPAVSRAVAALPANERRAGAALAVSPLLAVVPMLAVLPAPRVLGAAIPGIAFALAAIAVTHSDDRVTRPPGRLAAIAALFVALIHGPVTTVLDGLRIRARASAFTTGLAPLEDAIASGGPVYVVKGRDGAFFARFAVKTAPKAPIETLAQTGHVLLLRTGPRSVEVVYPKGPILAAANLFRDDPTPLRAGASFPGATFTATILRAGGDEESPRIRFDFHADADFERARWLVEGNAAFRAITLPEVGFGAPID